MRVNVYVPDELAESVRSQLPGINVSRILQAGLRASLGCAHHRLACAECAHPVDAGELVGDALGKFVIDLHWALVELVERNGTAEGAARVVHNVAERHQVDVVRNLPLPRPSRAQRADRGTAA